MSKTQEQCLLLLEQLRWGDVLTCPYCNSTKVARLKREQRYHCNNCFTSYSATVNTLFHRSHVNLNKWFRAIQLIRESSNSISVRQLAGEISVNKNTAAYMLIRIRQAMNEESELLKTLYLALENLEC
jgi:transposase-like protein